jgi:hypothetical protein
VSDETTADEPQTTVYGSNPSDVGFLQWQALRMAQGRLSAASKLYDLGQDDATVRELIGKVLVDLGGFLAL